MFLSSNLSSIKTCFFSPKSSLFSLTLIQNSSYFFLYSPFYSFIPHFLISSIYQNYYYPILTNLLSFLLISSIFSFTLIQKSSHSLLHFPFYSLNSLFTNTSFCSNSFPSLNGHKFFFRGFLSLLSLSSSQIFTIFTHSNTNILTFFLILSILFIKFTFH